MTIKISKVNLRRWYVEHGLWVVPGAILAIVVGLTIAVLIPAARVSWETKGVVEAERGKLEKLEEKLAALRQMNQLRLREQVEITELVLPSSKDVGLFLISLRQTAERSGVTLVSTDLTPGELEADGGKSKGSIAQAAAPVTGGVPIEVTVVGDLEGLKSFLREIQASVPITRVISFSFAEEGEGVQVKISLQGQYWPQPPSLGEAEKSLPGLTRQEEQMYQAWESLAVGIQQELRKSEMELPTVPLGNPTLIQ